MLCVVLFTERIYVPSNKFKILSGYGALIAALYFSSASEASLTLKVFIKKRTYLYDEYFL